MTKRKVSDESEEKSLLLMNKKNRENEVNEVCPKKEKDCANCKILICPEEKT